MNPAWFIFYNTFYNVIYSVLIWPLTVWVMDSWNEYGLMVNNNVANHRYRTTCQMCTPCPFAQSPTSNPRGKWSMSSASPILLHVLSSVSWLFSEYWCMGNWQKVPLPHNFYNIFGGKEYSHVAIHYYAPFACPLAQSTMSNPWAGLKCPVHLQTVLNTGSKFGWDCHSGWWWEWWVGRGFGFTVCPQSLWRRSRRTLDCLWQ